MFFTVILVIRECNCYIAPNEAIVVDRIPPRLICQVHKIHQGTKDMMLSTRDPMVGLAVLGPI